MSKDKARELLEEYKKILYHVFVAEDVKKKEIRIDQALAELAELSEPAGKIEIETMQCNCVACRGKLHKVFCPHLSQGSQGNYLGDCNCDKPAEQPCGTCHDTGIKETFIDGEPQGELCPDCQPDVDGFVKEFTRKYDCGIVGDAEIKQALAIIKQLQEQAVEKDAMIEGLFRSMDIEQEINANNDKEIKRYREALRQYAEHDVKCEVDGMAHGCTCGLEQSLKPTTAP